MGQLRAKSMSKRSPDDRNVRGEGFFSSGDTNALWEFAWTAGLNRTS